MESLVTSFIARIPTACSKQSPTKYNFCNRTRRSFFARPFPSFKAPRIVCMAEPYLITKLDSAEKTWKELSVKLADPDVVSNPSEYQKLAQSMAELDEVVSIYKEFKECEKQLEETKALAKEDGSDEDMVEMIASEIGTLSNQIKELEEKLKVLLLPSDPLDERNILLEVRAGTGGDEAGLWAGDLVGSISPAAGSPSRLNHDLSGGLQSSHLPHSVFTSAYSFHRSVKISVWVELNPNPIATALRSSPPENRTTISTVSSKPRRFRSLTIFSGELASPASIVSDLR
ncbi:hypothetical protein HHK36_032441 [Tetracentron sinense]|uniref:Peptide chain release factor domain-containing protein n=1 Tax=Tetracentron sinense TaxID=13715 RepID=A0A835CXK6_TETSI|nr:hypothetical protein HHK36_032441 [Tetracentron sinense]